MKSGSLFRWLRAAVACAAVGFSFAFPVASAMADGVGAVATQIPASAYVQDGLIAQWDGIDNAGTGTHDANASSLYWRHDDLREMSRELWR